MNENINEIIEANEGNKIYELALKYYHGDEQTEINYDLAIELLTKALELGENRAKFYLAESIYYGRGVEQSYEGAFNMFCEIVRETNNADAKFYIGEMYFYGYYVEKDDQKAYNIFTELVEQYDDMYSEHYLGVMYYYGKYVEQDYEKAYNIFSKISEKYDYMYSKYYLAIMYYYGKHAQQDREKAYNLFNELAENTDKWEAKYYIALMYYYGNYKEQDYEKAYDIFNELVEKYDDRYSKYYLGLMYYYGEFIQQDYKKAYEIFEFLVENYGEYEYKKEFAKILYNMGEDERALQALIEIESEDDDTGEVPYYIGEIYLQKNENEKAVEYFEKSSIRNNILGKRRLADIYIINYKEKEDIQKAIEIYQSFIDEEIEIVKNWAKYVLGNIYYFGKQYEYDIEEDKEKGIKFLKEAAEANIKQAIETLEEIESNKQ